MTNHLYFTRNHDETDSVPIELRDLQWDSHGDIDTAMEESRRRDLPILAVFTDWSKPEEWRRVFDDKDVKVVAENCFVIALFNTSHRSDPLYNEAMRWWGDGLHDCSDSGYVRIISPEGKMIARTEALIDTCQSMKEMERIFMEAWEKLETMRTSWERAVSCDEQNFDAEFEENTAEPERTCSLYKYCSVVLFGKC